MQFTGPWIEPVYAPAQMSIESVEIEGKSYTGAKISCAGFATVSGAKSAEKIVAMLPATHRPNYPATFKLFGKYDAEVDFDATIEPNGLLTIDTSKFAGEGVEVVLYEFELQYLLSVDITTE